MWRLLGAVLISTCAVAQQPVTSGTKTATDFKLEERQAFALIDARKYDEAVPLLEELETQYPKDGRYGEAMIECLAFQQAATTDPVARDKIATRKQTEWDRLKAMGYTSNYLKAAGDKENNANVNAGVAGASAHAQAAFDKAEMAFTKSDYATALKEYAVAADADPKFYEARLYAGDAAWKSGDSKLAGEWYAKAVEVNPDRETAYRYWGDALFKAGQTDAALGKYIEAIVAQPYSDASWVGLKQWAQRTGATLSGPAIQTPAPPTVGKDGKGVTITVDAASLGKDGKDFLGAAALMYQMNRSLWMQEKFLKAYPAENQYRHSLTEEVESLRLMLVSVREQKVPAAKWDASLKNLAALDDQHLLEPYVLISKADNGIAKDYDGYRAAHRDLLREYLMKWIVHPAKEIDGKASSGE